METFVGREKEFKTLRERLNDNTSTITVIYGRRRVGKSELLRQAYNDVPTLYFEGLENQSKSKQLVNFISQLTYQVKAIETPCEPMSSWHEAFKLLIPIIRNKNYVIIFDEFQWMANYRQEIISDLKMVWDQYLSRAGKISLILCGSIASFMIKNVIRGKALYGRTDQVIHVKPFTLNEAQKMLPRFLHDELLESYMLVGGIPKYLELVSKYSSLYQALQELAFSENGYFIEEYKRIFLSHFGKNEEYQKIIEILAEYPYGLTRKEIAEHTNIPLGGGLSTFLFNLESSGFIRSYKPLDKDEDTKLKKYCLQDSYLRFYFAFIKPNKNKIESGQSDIFYRITQSNAFYSYLGRSFEYLCIDHAKKISMLLGFSGIDYSVGPYFESRSSRNQGIQIDLVFNRADKVLSLCEIKYTKTSIGTQVIDETKQKEVLLEKKYARSIQKVLITKSPPTKDLLNTHYFYKIILASELV